MRKRFWAVAAMGLGLSATLAFAGPIEDRQQLMKQNGAAIKALSEMAQGNAPFDAAAVQENAQKLVTDFEQLKDLFPEGSDKGPPDTWAKPEIWTDREGFEAARMKAHEASTAALAVTDQAALGAAVQAIGGACQGCHEKYRTPKS
ncbi:MAG TPA: cytochrome c [Aestuariivirgaceae bacterium]|nr:cytochrome c [Aestuariivirgaceae bacterium]